MTARRRLAVDQFLETLQLFADHVVGRLYQFVDDKQ
jgi:hypothetical protein